jgi:hypothetical protein
MDGWPVGFPEAEDACTILGDIDAWFAHYADAPLDIEWGRLRDERVRADMQRVRDLEHLAGP